MTPEQQLQLMIDRYQLVMHRAEDAAGRKIYACLAYNHNHRPEPGEETPPGRLFDAAMNDVRTAKRMVMSLRAQALPLSLGAIAIKDAWREVRSRFTPAELGRLDDLTEDTRVSIQPNGGTPAPRGAPRRSRRKGRQIARGAL